MRDVFNEKDPNVPWDDGMDFNYGPEDDPTMLEEMRKLRHFNMPEL
jgi:hypothetical protein